MRALIITPMQPVRSMSEGQGITRRMKLFMSAIAGLAQQTRIAQLVPASLLDEDVAALERLQAQFWDMQLNLTLIPRGERKETFRNHYWDGVLRAQDQPLIHSFAGPQQAKQVGELLDQDPDLVFVHRLPAMCALLRSGRRPRNAFFDLDDVEHLVRLRYATRPPVWPGKLAYAAHVPALLRAEAQGIALSRQTFVCSARDQAILRRWSKRGQIAVIPNALPVPAEVTKPVGAPNLLFVGACDYLPNIETAERLVRDIFPLIRRAVPHARLLLAGKGSDSLPSRKLAPENVTYLGYVDDLDGLYRQTRIVCCPMRNGGGTRVKLIEAASHARPMVSSHIGAEGLDFEEGKEILLRDKDDEFAQACIGLLRDDQSSERLGLAARARMQALYDAPTIVERIRGIMLNGEAG